MRSEDRDRLIIATARAVQRLIEENPLVSVHVARASVELKAAIEQAGKSSLRAVKTDAAA